ncbi:hypothetical protein PRZ48_004944 [Zasmidium cellare]|uniref:Uncharacterized protein n=1 Tax=Zasmidium cellare TaxID=395010 RepID=A0ABR0ERN9_ZASCE|nr:hypothetical protein PRZ48_004944 [Zasmidium cellare]
MRTSASIISFLALALAASSAPTTSNQPLAVALHPDTHCAVAKGSSPDHPWPNSLKPNVCYYVPDGFQSFEIYAPPTKGTVNVYYDLDCVEGPGYSAQFQGCINKFGFAAKAVKYTPA